MNAAGWRGRIAAAWTGVDDAAPLVLVRIVYGLTVAVWGLSLVPDFDLVFAEDGLNRSIGWRSWNRVVLFRYVDGDLVLAVALAFVIAGGVAVAAGRGLRLGLPAVALVQYSLAQYAAPWAIGAEEVMRLFGLFLAVFALVTPRAFQGRLPGPGRDAGMAPTWVLHLLRIQLGLIYVVTALEKARGSEWHEGSAVFHALEIEHLRRFGAPAFLTDWEPLVKLATWSTLAVEFALAPLLFWPRTRRAAVVLAIGLHLGFELFLELGFFAPAMIVGILAFVSVDDANRVLRWRPARLRARVL